MNAKEKAKHTQGPWSTRDTTLGICRGLVTVEDVEAIEVSAGGQVVAYVPNDTSDAKAETVQRSNARLIEAAPDIYEALRAWSEICGDSCECGIPQAVLTSLQNMSRAALAKAGVSA